MPVRKIPRNYRHVTGRYAFPNGTSVAFEGTLERDFLYLMDFDPDVVGVEEQPVKVPVPGGRGRGAYYIPDFLVQRQEGPLWLVEVKSTDDLEKNAEDYEAKFKAAKSYADDRGWTFQIVTDKEIRTPKLKNIRRLLSYRNRKVDPGVCARLLSHANCETRITLGEILSRAFPEPSEQPVALPTLWHLVVIGHLDVDWEAELDLSSVATSGNGGTHAGR